MRRQRQWNLQRDCIAPPCWMTGTDAFPSPNDVRDVLRIVQHISDLGLWANQRRRRMARNMFVLRRSDQRLGVVCPPSYGGKRRPNVQDAMSCPRANRRHERVAHCGRIKRVVLQQRDECSAAAASDRMMGCTPGAKGRMPVLSVVASASWPACGFDSPRIACSMAMIIARCAHTCVFHQGDQWRSCDGCHGMHRDGTAACQNAGTRTARTLL